MGPEIESQMKPDVEFVVEKLKVKSITAKSRKEGTQAALRPQMESAASYVGKQEAMAGIGLDKALGEPSPVWATPPSEPGGG